MPKHPFEYQRPNEDQIDAIIQLRLAFRDLHNLLLKKVSPCRERSLAITKLEEANMWINKAVVMSDDDGE